MTWIQQNTKTKNDAVIGIVFTAMFSIGVIGISAISRTGVHLDLKDFLFGNVLGVSNQDLVMTGIVMVMVVLKYHCILPAICLPQPFNPRLPPRWEFLSS